MRKKFTRISACFMAVLIAFNLVAVPKAEAVLAETTIGTAALASYLTATGVPLTVVSGGAGAVTGGMGVAISGYAAASGTTSAAVTSAIAAGTTISTGGVIILTVAACALLAGITAYLIDEYGLKDAEEPVLVGPALSDDVSYNGTMLPPLPEWDKSTYPYAFILQTSSDTRLFVTSQPIVIYSYWPRPLYNAVGKVSYYTASTNTWRDFSDEQSYSQHNNSFGDNPYYVKWANHDVYNATWSGSAWDLGSLFLSESNPGISVDPEQSVAVQLTPEYEAPPSVEDQHSMVINTGLTAEDEQGIVDAILAGIVDNSFAPTYTIEADTSGNPGEDPGAGSDNEEELSLLGRIADGIDGLADRIKDGIASLFAPDPTLMKEITDTFSAKFDFMSDLYALGTDLLNLDPEQTPPVIYIHLEDAESNYGFTYGGTTKALDMAWYERYKADVDRIMSGFLWLGFLWLCFMRASDIINGAGMVYDAGRPVSFDPGPDYAPRLPAPGRRRRY